MFHLESFPSDVQSWQDCREMHGVEDLNVLIAHYYPCLSSDIEGLCKQRRCQEVEETTEQNVGDQGE